MYDLIPLLPLQLLRHKYARLYFLLKCIRIKKSLTLLSTAEFMRLVHVVYGRRLKKACNDENLKDNQDLDNNEIMAQIWIKNFFETFRLIIIVFLFSYYIGMLFYIFADLTNDIDIVAQQFDDSKHANFIMFNGLDQKTPLENAIIITYFSFTSLSTVGFGDYNPRSNPERLFTCAMLMFGVAVFSYIMGNFIEIITKMKDINASFSDGDNLARFFGLLKMFNSDKQLEHDIMVKIESYFEYKWEQDCNLAIHEEEDFHLLNQLQYSVQVDIYHTYLFNKFLKSHKHFFEFPKEYDGI